MAAIGQLQAVIFTARKALLAGLLHGAVNERANSGGHYIIYSFAEKSVRLQQE